MPYHMLFSFNLADGTTTDEVQTALTVFNDQLVDLDLLHSTTPLARRHRHAVLDTAPDNPHEFFVTMRFRDLAQANDAVSHIYDRDRQTTPPHLDLIRLTSDPVFICFQDHELTP